MVSGIALACAGAALLVGCASPNPDAGAPNASDERGALRTYCDRSLRSLDHHVGPAQYSGRRVSRGGMEAIAGGLKRVRPEIKERLDPSPRSRRLLRLLRRAQLAAARRDGDNLLGLLEEAWLVAARLGVPQCHIGSAGRPS